MTARILIADDSLTIQKVIGITLASSGYELVECLTEAEMLKHIQNEDFNLILLDFNLSESRSGYELAKEIKNARPNAGIMIMLGTFDTVDESQFAACGISDKIIKPFESGKFIKKCKDLIDRAGSTADSTEPLTEKEENHEPEETFSIDSKVDLWMVDTPNIKKDVVEDIKLEVETTHNELHLESVEEKITQVALDPLSSELAGWGLDVGVNLEAKYNKAFPGIIEQTHTVNALERLQESSDFVIEEDAVDELSLEPATPTPHHDTTEPLFEIPNDFNQKLIAEVNEEVSPESFWAVDDVVTIELDDSKDIKATHLNEIVTPVSPDVHAFEPIDEIRFEKEPMIELETRSTPLYQPSAPVQTFAPLNEDAIVEKLKISLRPMIEELVREYCRQNVDKIAWEVIPDLAENLIRKELKEISESIQ